MEVKSPQAIKLDPNVVPDRYFSPAENYIVPTRDKYILAKYAEFEHEERDLLIQAICMKVSEGHGRMKACELAYVDDKEGLRRRFMSFFTLKFWLRHCPEYGQWMKDAEEDRQEHLFEEVLTITDDLVKDDEYGNLFMKDADRIRLAKARQEARKWALSKMNKEKYGTTIQKEEKKQIEVIWNEKKTYKAIENTINAEFEEIKDVQDGADDKAD